MKVFTQCEEAKKKYESVWDAIENTPAEAESFRTRSALMIALQEHLKNAGMTQIQAAKKLAVTQPRISDLMRGRIDLFSLESLIDMAAKAGLRVEFKLKKIA